MRNYTDHLIASGSKIKDALNRFNILGKDAILFVVDHVDTLLGSLTDGDVRRGLLRGVSIEDEINLVIHVNPKFIRKGESNLKKIIEYREGNFRILPVVDKNNIIINVINFNNLRSYLPVDAVIMAGGRGKRLQPLTDKVPKPLLKVGAKTIMEYNVDRLALYGIDDFWFSIKYLGEQIEAFFGNGTDRNIKINYVKEEEALGTIGAVSVIDNFLHDCILVTNSDILTNLDYEHFYLDFIEQDADFAVVTIPYQVNIPYAVLETSNSHIIDFKEKPCYTYYSNGGIYLMKKTVLQFLPFNSPFDATDLMQSLIKAKKKVISYPLAGYWLDIGKHEDYNKAQEDIKHLVL